MDFLQRQKLMFSKEELKEISGLTVLIAGAGGLGTHQVIELQRAGVKKIYLIDSDKIEISNLNRQVLYGRDDIGEFKAIKAKEILDDFKLGTKIVAITKRVTEDTEIPSDVDLIFDALDNFESRYELEKLAAKYKLPLIHGGVSSWYGQITTIIPDKTSSLKEIIGSEQSKAKEIPVFSPVVSVIASLQVIEGFKVILNKEDTLINKLLIIDLSDYSLSEIEI
ncbi:HesA/MoeB/ThiF family protein [Sporohalobacter salinus]|uniref:HesA/MoeB/ThiF family protein n=1 Tax=Sporohalobacter salinus TaxID=1494606 RepID=UPI0019614E9B|nr:HesA/MoeB/ThiF family protein [Sporohalobacter salinus]MBM7623367.1 molybdopterin/thiamine biosynthesis adenylyltransferase [Sporohalobacter salinus]